jgi:hypothetical protein
MTTQTEAERLAEILEQTDQMYPNADVSSVEVAAELRRLVSFNNQLMDEVARLQKREWVGLTVKEVKTIWGSYFSRGLEFAEAIEAKLKAKNERKEKNQ